MAVPMNANQTEKPYRLLALGRLPAATRDGRMFVSDEFAANIYCFAADAA
ncbi:MAG: hypothetical protein KBA31_05495 [Alphaproteobacteria bacterium]|nr:hypothetical protein [Alphaproteobacteria bacterium]